MRRRRIERGDGSPSSGEEIAFRSKRWRKKRRQVGVRHWIPSRLLWKFNGNVQAAFKAYAEEEGNARAALKEAEEESIRQNDGTILIEGCLDDEELLMDQSALHASCSSSQSGDAQEEALFDREGTNLLLKMDKKPKPCSGDPGKIAQDEDEDGYSDKKPLTVVEDEHSDKIGAYATDGDHKQEQGSARCNVQDLLNMDDETLSNKILHFSKLLNIVSPVRDYTLVHNDDQLIKLHEQLALYRIRAYELTVNRKLAKLDDVDLKREYPPSKLYDKGFFTHYEERLEWYFDPELYWHPRFDNYQRLVLRYGGYLDLDFYRSILNTYEEDLAYVQYFEALANKTKWIEDYLGDSTIERDKIKGVARMQSLETAAGFPNVSPLLVLHCFDEYFNSICSDYSDKRLCVLYFEIWKLVAKGKMSFKEALLEVNRLENTQDISRWKDHYDARVAGIDKMASDDEARQLIREAIIRMDPKPKYYLDYARKKLDIAKDIGLV